MIKHIVMFKLIAFDGEEEKTKTAVALKKELETLPEKIKEIREFEAGINILKKEASFDVVLVSVFDNLKALQTYSDHPEHQKVVSYIKKITVDRKVVDYEC